MVSLFGFTHIIDKCCLNGYSVEYFNSIKHNMINKTILMGKDQFKKICSGQFVDQPRHILLL